MTSCPETLFHEFAGSELHAVVNTFNAVKRRNVTCFLTIMRYTQCGPISRVLIRPRTRQGCIRPATFSPAPENFFY